MGAVQGGASGFQGRNGLLGVHTSTNGVQRRSVEEKAFAVDQLKGREASDSRKILYGNEKFFQGYIACKIRSKCLMRPNPVSLARTYG
jgi:hypothetical protein